MYFYTDKNTLMMSGYFHTLYIKTFYMQSHACKMEKHNTMNINYLLKS